MSAIKEDAMQQNHDGSLHLRQTRSQNDTKGPIETTESSLETDRDSQTRLNATDEVIDPHAGVSKVEAFNKVLRQSGKGRTLLWTLGVSIGLTMFAYSIDQGTTYLFNAYSVSALGSHSSLAAVNVAGQIVRSIAKPFLGKLADITSRPTTYTVVLIAYAIGFAVAASAQTVAAYVVGSCLTAFGKSGLDFLGDVIVADLTTLQWRAFFGSLLSLPFVVTAYIDGFVSTGFLPDNWRWGLGMFAIMIPALLIPAIVTLYTMEAKAKKLGMVSAGASQMKKSGGQHAKVSWRKLLWQAIIDIDLFGLILLGFAFALILLALALFGNAKGGIHNPSMIAMLVVGCILLPAFILYETFIAPKPCVTKNIFMNRAFVSAVGIDVSTQLASGITSTYFASYIVVGKDWTTYQTTAFNNTVTVMLCVLGPITGLILAKTHRFKGLMTLGAVIKLVGNAMQLQGTRSNLNTGVLVASQLLSGFGSFTVIGTRVGSQASVPHSDLASIIAQLSLWSSLASAVGGAISGAIWQNNMLRFMREECPANTPEKTLAGLYANIASLKAYPYDSPLRQCAIVAYTRVNGIFFIVGSVVCVITIAFCFLMPNYYLGKQHNAVTSTSPDGEAVEVAVHEVPPATGVWARFKQQWSH